ncbi:MFS transporter [Jeotgalibacillus marinus]|uniref:MFS transporter n=1 Tax=Jeotgalibacillus marinus TaxID=86667 RepID=A0ABV3Q6H3_9BACL
MSEIFTNNTLRTLILANLFSSVGKGMVLIGISWNIVESTGTASPLGITILFSTAIMILIGPYIGIYIDKYSRKKILLTANFSGAVILSFFSLWGIFWGSYSTSVLTIIYVVSMVIRQIYFPAQYALVQETFKPKKYQKINSVLEVQNQVVKVMAGVFAVFILVQYSLHTVFIITSITYLIAFLLLIPLKYSFTVNEDKKTKKNSYKELTKGLKFIINMKGFIIFGLSVFTPFVVFMVGNLLAPAFVNIDLQENVSVFSSGEITYALGAVLAGILVTRILTKICKFTFLITNITLFSISLIGMVLILKGWAFVLVYLFMGWTVSSTRLISQTIFMEIVPKNLMGRVMITLDLLSLVIRVILIAIFTISIDIVGAGSGYLILSVLLFGAAMGISYSVKHIKEAVENIKEAA